MKLTLSDVQSLIMHVGGLAAVAVLIGTGTIASDVGVPLLTGLVGLGINTASNVVASVSSTTTSPTAPVPVAAAPVPSPTPAAPVTTPAMP